MAAITSAAQAAIAAADLHPENQRRILYATKPKLLFKIYGQNKELSESGSETASSFYHYTSRYNKSYRRTSIRREGLSSI